MWRRTYLLLILIRLYFALSPSYLHPDENFQGPEVIAGEIFNYPVKLTWEFTSEHPVRSVFPLWPVYGLPMLLLKWIWIGNGKDGEVAPVVVFWTLRVLMFGLSFVLEDWAIHELIHSPRHRRIALLLVASSYVTWTYQTHTFSNSIETLLVVWSLVLIQRIVKAKDTPLFAPIILGFFAVLGIFTRITFPAFLLIPGMRLIPIFLKSPLTFVSMALSGLLTAFVAVFLDTSFYSKQHVTWSYLLSHPVITPWNNLTYNLSTSNLASHGLHPWYQHLFINLPQLLGPAYILFFVRPHASLRLYSAISGIIVLSLFQHQEARFLLPTVPLILSSVRLPKGRSRLRVWAGMWLLFNVIFSLLMGIYHQGGIVSTQVFLSSREDATQALWWKTYSPPIWLLNGKNEMLTTHDLMGMRGDLMIENLKEHTLCNATTWFKMGKSAIQESTYLIAPTSATYLDNYVAGEDDALDFERVWHYRRHLNLDDLDFGDDGVWNTLARVVGRRGLDVWRVTRSCANK